MILTRPLCALDLETTSVDPQQARIVQVAFVMRYPDDTPPLRWSTLVNPRVPIPAEAHTVHGIADAKVQGCRTCGGESTHPQHRVSRPDADGCHAFKPWPTFAAIAANLASGLVDCDYAGFHVRYDLRVLEAEMARAGVEWTYQGARILDGHRLWQVLSPRTLSDACRHWLGREPSDAHDAVADAHDALAIIDTQIEALSALSEGLTLDDIHASQWPDDAKNIDPDGKFQWGPDGEAVLAFGKLQGTRLRDAAKIDRGFLQWMLGKDFSPVAKRIARDALAGTFPHRPTSSKGV
jgi:DNA polymerase III epsilon subunit-like protein